ncbi:MAG: DUF424 domain-containing protein [Candidatus Micrarchaeota archaeon]
MYLKVHKRSEGKIVAVCDRELIGRVLEEGDVFLDLDTYRGFYVGEIASKDEVKKALGKFSSANLVGEKAVDVALNMKLAKDDDVTYINTIPYIQLYRIGGGESV